MRALGYDERFVRTWDFYLAVCEAGFRTRWLRDAQVVLTAMSWWALLLARAGRLTAALQLSLWLWQRRTGSATAVDAGWAASLAGMGILYALLGQGELEHRLLDRRSRSASRSVVSHTSSRSASAGRRTSATRSCAGAGARRAASSGTFFVFYQAQALVAVLLSLPFLAAAYNDHDGLEALEWVGPRASGSSARRSRRSPTTS